MTRQDILRMAIHSELAPYDAFSGSAYGERNMPFIIGPAIGAASAAIGVAAAAGTAASIGAAVVATVGAISAVATVAGLAMSVIGMATGDKSLMKIGMYVGLAGGIGSLGTMGANAALNATSASYQAATSAATAAQTASGATSGLEGITNAGSAFEAGAATPQAALQGAQQTATGAVANTAGNVLADTSSKALTEPTALGGNANTLTGSTSSLGQSTPVSLTQGGGDLNLAGNISNKITPSMPGSTAISNMTADASTASSGATTASGFFDKATLMTIGGTGLAGIYKGYAQQQQNDITQQQNAYNQGVTNFQVNNLNHPAAYGYTAPPVTAQQQQAGQINNAQRAKQTAGVLTA